MQKEEELEKEKSVITKRDSLANKRESLSKKLTKRFNDLLPP
jgi:hypothetical protein